MIARIGKALWRAYLNGEAAFSFWSKVDRRGPDECWPWTGNKHARGYGHMKFKGVHRRATHVSWELANASPFPEGLCARHSCDNPNCVNPAHIIPGTHAENMADRKRDGRAYIPLRTHCRKSGHALTPDNIKMVGGRRRCKTCFEAHAAKRLSEDYYRNWRLSKRVNA